MALFTPVKTSLLVGILAATSTTTYFVTKMYLMMSEQKAQMVAVQQREHDFWTNKGRPIPEPNWSDPGLGRWK